MSAATTWGYHWQVLRDSWAAETEDRRDRQQWRETQFLPAALEVVETPPNPLGRILLWTMMAFVAAGILWACLAKIDVVAVARGKVIAADHNKLIQAADAGVVREIYVRDGQTVHQGQALLALDPTTAGADQTQASQALLAAEIDAARARAVLAGLQGRPAVFVVPEGTPPAVAATERLTVTAKLAEYHAKIATLRAQADEARAQGGQSSAEIARLADTLPLLRERVEKRRILADKGYSSRLLQLELDEQQLDRERQIGVQQQTLRKAQASLAGVGQQIAMARAETERQLLGELTKAETEASQRAEELRKAGVRSGLQLLKSPVDGTVQQLAVYTVGAVLKPADPILVIVPRNARLVVEAQILDRDIAFVRTGQPVMLKLDAFPFTRYGTVSGKLTQLSRDAVQNDKLGPVYDARVSLDTTSIEADGRRAMLTPGLAATVEVQTAKRRVIDFLLSPLERRLSEAGRER